MGAVGLGTAGVSVFCGEPGESVVAGDAGALGDEVGSLLVGSLGVVSAFSEEGLGVSDAVSLVLVDSMFSLLVSPF